VRAACWDILWTKNVEVKVEDKVSEVFRIFTLKKKSRGSKDSFFGRSEGFFSFLEVKFKEILAVTTKKQKQKLETWDYFPRKIIN